MSREYLKLKLEKDLEYLFLPVDEFEIIIRPFSTSYYGKYTPKNFNKRHKKAVVWIYPYKHKNGEMFEYSKVLKTAIHEVCHHLQYTDPDYTRRKGIMHNADFYKLLDKYCKRAVKFNLMEEAV